MAIISHDGLEKDGMFEGCNWKLCMEISPLQPSVYVPPTIPRSAHALYLCVLCGSQNKQPLFPYTTLTDWFV
jgi:hypothetical protein